MKSLNSNSQERELHQLQQMQDNAKEVAMNLFSLLHSFLRKINILADFGVLINLFQEVYRLAKYFLDYYDCNVKKSVAERTRHKRQYDRRMNERHMQSRDSKVVLSKALDVSLVVTECSGTKSDEHITSTEFFRGLMSTMLWRAVIRPVKWTCSHLRSSDSGKGFCKYNIKNELTSTPTKTQKPLLKDEDGEEVDVHLYRSMIYLLMYLTSLRPNIMFAVCACARYQVNQKVSHLYAVKRIFRYLKGQPKLSLWYLKDSPFDLVAYTDSDYAGASLDRKSTIGDCKFLRCRLISWQCKKQTMVANYTTEAEYVAASSCCGQVLWIQNQLLNYGYNFMYTKIYINNESTICIVKNPVFPSKTKHIEIRHHFIRDSNEKKLIQMIKIHTDKHVADFLTKAFDKIIITEATVRRDLQLEDAEGIDCLPNADIFEQLTLMGYEKLSQKLTFYKAFFSPQWKFLIHTILQCLSAKTTAWNEFSSTMASAIICLATNQKFNFSKYIFESMVKNLDNAGKFLMYPRFIQVFLDNQLEGMATHNRIYIAPSHIKKIFANMRRQGKDFSGRVKWVELQNETNATNTLSM
ncbi:hypothetical protein Tco_1191669 [Tanacetum coccineum]